MRKRHHIPSIFNIALVDVLCCALGCVILLWLLNSREAKTRAKQAGATRSQLRAAEARLASLTRDLEAARRACAEVGSRLARQREANRRLTAQVAGLAAGNRDQAAALARGKERSRQLDRDILDWQQKHRRAEERLAGRQADNRKLEAALVRVRSRRAAADAKVALLTRRQQALFRELAALKEQHTLDDKLLRKKALQTADMERELAALKKQNGVAVSNLAARTGEKHQLEKVVRELRGKACTALERVAALTKERAELQEQVADLQKSEGETEARLRTKRRELQEREKLLDGLRSQNADAEKRLRSAEALVKSLRTEAELVSGLRAGAADLRGRLAEAERRVLALQKALRQRGRELRAAGAGLDEVRTRLGALRRDRDALARQVSRVREAAAERFAGIALTGTRVLFLVDMSGSMELVDRRTRAPAKWAGVRDTVVKILGSLPDLDKFQVVLFARDIRYPLGGDGRWLDFDPRASADAVAAALAKVSPSGGTNMYAGFQEAFRFRPQGLDTVYVLSDGLPNMGEGLSFKDLRRLRGNKQAEVLSKYIRRKLKTRWNRPESGRRVRINTIGFFYESPDVGSFLWALARENDGSFVGMSIP
jgi:hypothetical protein